MTTLQLHQAALAAADEDAQTLELVCTRAGVKVLKTTNAYTGTGSRQTIAIKQIEALVSRRGPKLAREILEVLANAERGPLTAPQIKAVEMLLTDEEYCDKITPEDLTDAIVDLLFTAEDEAKLFAATHKVPFGGLSGSRGSESAKSEGRSSSRLPNYRFVHPCLPRRRGCLPRQLS